MASLPDTKGQSWALATRTAAPSSDGKALSHEQLPFWKVFPEPGKQNPHWPSAGPKGNGNLTTKSSGLRNRHSFGDRPTVTRAPRHLLLEALLPPPCLAQQLAQGRDLGTGLNGRANA